MALAGLVALGLLRAGAWAVLLEVPSPIDEVQHVAYVDTLLTEGRPPVTGHDVIPAGMARLAKASPTFAMRSRPVPADPRHPGWGPVGQSYEGGQTPLGYAPFVPVWAFARHLDPSTGLFVLRLAAVMVAVLPLPLLVVAGRRCFPDRPGVGWLAAGLYLAVPAAWAHTAIAAGDAVVPTAGLLTLLAVLSVPRRDADLRSALGVGLAAAGLLLVKPTTLGLVPPVLVAGTVLAIRGRPWRRWVRWAAVTAGAAVVAVSPWLVWNLLAYGSTSGAEANDAILGGAQFDVPFGWAALRLHAREALGGLFGVPRGDLPWDPLELRWLLVLVVVTGAGVVVALRRRRPAEAGVLAVLAGTLPAAWGGMLLVVFVVFGGRSSVVGRHLLVAVPLACLAIAGGAVVALGRRWAPVALLLLVGLALLPREAILTRRLLDTTYLDGAPAAALVAQADLAVAEHQVTGLVVDAPCPVTDVDVVTAGRDLPAPHAPDGRAFEVAAHPSVVRPGWHRVAVDPPRERVDLRFPDPRPVLPVTRDGTVAHRVWCEDDDGLAVTWAAMHDPLHPLDVPWSWVAAWLWILGAGAPAACVLLAGGLAVRGRGLR